MRDLVRRHADGFMSTDTNRPRATPGKTHDCAQRCGAAGSVASEQRHHFASMHGQVHAMKNVRFTVPCLCTNKLERRLLSRRLTQLFRAALFHDRAHACAPASEASALPM